VKEIHLWILGKGTGGRGTLNSPSDGNDLRIFGGLKFFILEFFGYENVAISIFLCI